MLIKIGLQANIPPLTFAGLRYTLGFLCLVPLVWLNPAPRAALHGISRPLWIQLIGLGSMWYTLTQGAQFVGLQYLPAATQTLLLNFTPVVVALLSGFSIHEKPSAGQWGGILLSAIGGIIYFFRLEIPSGQLLGLGVGLLGLFANAGSFLLGRQVNTRSGLSPLLVTTVSMGIGGGCCWGSGWSHAEEVVLFLHLERLGNPFEGV